MSKFTFTSESVTEGHPDKVCDAISDAIVDSLLLEDRESHIACETLATKNLIVVSGEVRSKGIVDIENIVRNTLEEIGYTDINRGMDNKSVEIMIKVQEQSTEIARGVDQLEDHEQGAGDQGLMFGYACKETPELMPMPIMYAHKLVKKLADVRKKGQIPYLRPDSKSQVSVRYENDKPICIETIVISTQHNPGITNKKMRADITELVINKIIPERFRAKRMKIHINPTGNFVVGGPHGDCGLTGRKIIVDTYGGFSRHGGGAFSGKDPSKVDRSAAYMARYIAKNLVAAGTSDRLEVQLAYAIGVADPVSVFVETFGTHKINPDLFEGLIRNNFDLKPAGIIKTLDLLKPRYSQTAAYGHFGRKEAGFTWERTDKVKAIIKSAKL